MKDKHKWEVKLEKGVYKRAERQEEKITKVRGQRPKGWNLRNIFECCKGFIGYHPENQCDSVN